MKRIAKTTKEKSQAETFAYWRSRPVQERLDAVEELREAFIRTLPEDLQVFQKVLRIVPLSQADS